MSKFKKTIKDDLEKSLGVDKMSFDVTQLDIESNPSPKKRFDLKLVLIPAFSLALVAIVTVTGIAMMNNMSASSKYGGESATPDPNYDSDLVEVHTFEKNNKDFSIHDKKIADYNASILKSVNYPTYKGNEKYSNEQMNSYLSFANDILKEIDYQSYSPVTLFQISNAIANGISDDELLDIMNNDVLRMNKNTRDNLSKKITKNNFYYTDFGTTQIHNSIFYNDFVIPNEDYLEEINNLYFEGYQFDFDAYGDRIVEWVNNTVNMDLIDLDYLEIDAITGLYLISTLYFSHQWSNLFISEATKSLDFHLSNGETMKKEFMSHSYIIDKYYDYEDYYSVSDYFYNGNSVTYYFPKSVNDNIIDLISNKNFLIEDENKAVTNEFNTIYVDLSVPKFTDTSSLELKEAFSSLGLEKLFNDHYSTFDKPYVRQHQEDRFYLDKIKQKNSVTFSEDGALVASMAEAESSAPGEAMPITDESITVTLNQPFIYVIKDHKDLPLYIGYIENPSL